MSTMQKDDCTWRTIHGSAICLKPGENPSDAFKRFDKLKDVKFSPKSSKKDSPSKDVKNISKGGLSAEPSPLEKDSKTIQDLGLKKDRIDILESHYKENNRFYDDGSSFENVRVSEYSVMGRMSQKEELDYGNALEKGNYDKSDTIFIKALSRDPKELAIFKEQTEEVIGFNKALADKVKNTKEIYRFVTIGELDSYVEDPQFTNRYNQEFISATVEEHSKFFGEREVTLYIPTDDIKNELTPVPYTTFPRNEEREELLDSEKFQKYGSEAEVRIKAGTKIPRLKIKFNNFYTAKQMNEMKQKYGKLGEITFANRPMVDYS